jgi:hypothetical protein
MRHHRGMFAGVRVLADRALDGDEVGCSSFATRVRAAQSTKAISIDARLVTIRT